MSMDGGLKVDEREKRRDAIGERRGRRGEEEREMTIKGRSPMADSGARIKRGEQGHQEARAPNTSTMIITIIAIIITNPCPTKRPPSPAHTAKARAREKSCRLWRLATA